MHVPPHRSLAVAIGALAIATAAPAVTRAGDTVPPAPDDVARPFSEVQNGPLLFEADPANPQRGIFHVTTTEPMICAIVWGPTEELGRFNNSLSMNGTGIVDHDVVLPGIEPAREYFYVVQGTTADGTW